MVVALVINVMHATNFLMLQTLTMLILFYLSGDNKEKNKTKLKFSEYLIQVVGIYDEEINMMVKVYGNRKFIKQLDVLI